MASWSRVCCQPATWFGQSPWRCFGSGRGVEVCTRQLLAVLSEGSVAPPAFTLTGRPAPVRTVVRSEEARQKQETVLGWEGPGRGRDYRETEGSPGPLQVRGRGAPAEAPGKAQSGPNGNLLFPELFLEDCGPSTPVMLWGPTNTAAQLSCWENLRPACGADLGDRFPQCQGPPLRLHPQLVRVSVGDVGGCGTRRDEWQVSDGGEPGEQRVSRGGRGPSDPAPALAACISCVPSLSLFSLSSQHLLPKGKGNSQRGTTP